MRKLSRRSLMKLGAGLGAGLAAAKTGGLVSPKEAQAAEISACVIGHYKVKDDEKWGEYRGKVPQTLVQWGGEVIFRGRLVKVLSGQHSYVNSVIIQFPDSKSASGWYNSAAYQALIPIREQAADMLLVICEK
ncbi:MAG TPA: DUF1330 domain-containing protein [Syntrophobacteraceae bacterium]|nr:DUF1330 domain-containing protein [Syntrophobacteraceae bacterium]